MSETTASRPAAALRADDKPIERAPQGAVGKLGGVAGWVDDRTRAAKGVNYLLRKVFPDHWSFMLGEIAMYSLIVCLLTGAFLTFWFVPSMGQTVYDGSYIPLQGVVMSEAYASTLDISFDIKGGLLIRQIHHWAALMFIVSLSVHMMRVFFTGAFRKPRELNWVIGTVLALLAIVEGFAGYSLPDDLLSGTGLRAMQGFILTVPVIGSYIAYALFGGDFPGEMIIPRLYAAHVLLIPAILVGLFIVHVTMVAVNKHTQYPGPGKTNDNVVGYRVMPVYAAKAGGFFFLVFGLTALIAAFAQINAIWVHGPYDPSAVTAGAQPDWYMWFSDGALRLLPGWIEFTVFGFTFSPNIAIGSIILLPLVYTVLGAYPFVERWITGDDREHHLLDRPRNAPTRTGVGMAAITGYTVLALACVNDIIAIKLGMSINDLTRFFRVAVFLLPILVFWITKRICLGLQRHDRELVLHGRETGTVIRTPEGRFFERHEDLDPYTRWRLVSFDTYRPIEIEPATDANGLVRKGARKDRLRAALSRFYFTDQIHPVTPAELAAAHHDGHGHEALEGAAEEEYPEQIGADR